MFLKTDFKWVFHDDKGNLIIQIEEYEKMNMYNEISVNILTNTVKYLNILYPFFYYK